MKRESGDLGFGRIILVLALIGGVTAYTFGVVTGRIGKDQRVDAVHLGVLVLAIGVSAIILSPGVLGRFRAFEVKGIKIEMDQVREKQLEQESQLNDIRLLIPLLLPDDERRHLQNLSRGRTAKYRGSEALRAELRRLRTIGLVHMLSEQHWISHIEDGREVDLADFMELTDLGRRWVKRLNELDEPRTGLTIQQS